MSHIAFLQQQWLRERASVLRYTYIACLVLVLLESVTKEPLDLTYQLYIQHVPTCVKALWFCKFEPDWQLRNLVLIFERRK